MSSLLYGGNMIKRQFLGIKWSDNIPKLMLYDRAKDFIEKNVIEIGSNISIERTDEKRCVGYYDVENRKHVACRAYTNMTDKGFSQCFECRNLSKFTTCVWCNGSVCKNNHESALKFCQNQHYVYSAYFASDKLKVGTAVYSRRYERLLEQGALYSIFIAKTPTGKLARQIESEVAKLDVTTKVNISYKINNLIIEKNQNEISNMLLEKYDEVKSSLKSELKEYLILPEHNNFLEILYNVKSCLVDSSNQLSIFEDNIEYKEYKKILKPTKIKGIVKAVIGSLMLLENNEVHYLVNMKALEGFVININ